MKLLQIAMAAALLAAADNGLCQVTNTSKPAPQADPRVAKSLKEAGVKYFVDETGDYVIFFSAATATNPDRSRKVWVNSQTSTFGTTELREVWSLVHVTKTPLSDENAHKLLRRNAVIKMGAWQTQKGKDYHAVLFSLKVDATAKASVLSDAAEFVAITADGVAKEMEKGKLWSPDDP